MLVKCVSSLGWWGQFTDSIDSYPRSISFELRVVKDRVPKKEEWIQLVELQASEEEEFRSSWRSPFLNPLSYSMRTWSVCMYVHARETETGGERERCVNIYLADKISISISGVLKKAYILLGTLFYLLEQVQKSASYRVGRRKKY